ncbi:transketolase [Candidatus Peregrinibacteria bacterium]|nr:transketolase [Candidatus Peregrinibacteria bacterium]
MFKKFPETGEQLNKEHLDFLRIFTKSCRKSILQMVVNAQSGHPGGSLSSLDFLATIYPLILSRTGEKIVISNGHISPAVYSVLAELGYIIKEDVIKNFRKVETIYEGHITRHVPGVYYGTGPLGIGVSVASGFAIAEKMKKTDKKVFALMGDGEAQEGQVHEMIHFCKQRSLNNLILFVDHNQVQLTGSLREIMDINIKKIFEAGDWNVIEIDGHSHQKIWNAVSEAYKEKNKPTVIIGKTIMGYGIDFMEKAGKELKSEWHGKSPKKEEAEGAISALKLSKDEEKTLEEFRKSIKGKPEKPKFPDPLTKTDINDGKPIVYNTDTLVDCRTAYGKALLDLAKINKEIIALSADLKGSVMTKFVSAELPRQYIECGIAEQHMVSLSGGLSLSGFAPFASSFGAFLSSRAKDQARVNDINYCNTKLVATHCGLSVGEDGPTHQAIDDASSFLGFFNTMIAEPADPNQTDRIIRYIASHYGNFYIRMGRHKIPVITKEDGSIFYDEKYEYYYGRSDILRKGSDLTLIAIGSMVCQSLEAYQILKKTSPEISVELTAATSIKKFDRTLVDSIKKTKKIITVEDHNINSGLGSQIAYFLEKEEIKVEKFLPLGIKKYQLSGKPEELYELEGLSPEKIAKQCIKTAT